MWKSLLALLTVLAGCGGNGRPTIKLNADAPSDSLGVRFASADDLERAMQDHRRNGEFYAAYLPDEYDEWIESKDGGQLYSSLNDALHERVEHALREHFRDFPLPVPYVHTNRNVNKPAERYRAFTYQNRDWFDTNSQIRVQVAGDFISRTLLATLQKTLTGDHYKWGILILAAPSTDFDAPNPFKIFVTSDSALITDEFASVYRSNAK